MSTKQDRTAARTVSDLERKYDFNKSFAEVMGVATDARAIAEDARNPAQYLTPEEVFNLFTDNGKQQGLFKAEDGQVYINASYLRTGIITSEDEKIKIDLSGNGGIPVFSTGISTDGVTVRCDEENREKLIFLGYWNDIYGIPKPFIEFYDVNGNQIMLLSEAHDRSGCLLLLSNDAALTNAEIRATNDEASFTAVGNGSRASLTATASGSELRCDNVFCYKILGQSICWKYNETIGYYLGIAD